VALSGPVPPELAHVGKASRWLMSSAVMVVCPSR
jgi:hypothetical protein